MTRFTLLSSLVLLAAPAFAGTHYSVICGTAAKMADKLGPKVLFSTEDNDPLQEKGRFYSSPFSKKDVEAKTAIDELCVIQATTGLVWGLKRDFDAAARQDDRKKRAELEMRALVDADKTAFRHGLER